MQCWNQAESTAHTHLDLPLDTRAFTAYVSASPVVSAVKQWGSHFSLFLPSKDITHTALSPLQCKICSCPKLKQTTHPSLSAGPPEEVCVCVWGGLWHPSVFRHSIRNWFTTEKQSSLTFARINTLKQVHGERIIYLSRTYYNKYSFSHNFAGHSNRAPESYFCWRNNLH